MDWHLIVFEVIDMRSFSNLWFWIALAVMWSTASHWVLGVPFDMVTRARRHGGQAQADLDQMVRINVNRVLYIAHEAGLWLLGLVCFLLTTLIVLGFVYWIELAQALFLLGFPMTIVSWLGLRTARRLQADGTEGRLTPALMHRRLNRLRIATQVIGMLSIFVTSLWGMYQNLSASFLG